MDNCASIRFKCRYLICIIIIFLYKCFMFSLEKYFYMMCCIDNTFFRNIKSFNNYILFKKCAYKYKNIIKNLNYFISAQYLK